MNAEFPAAPIRRSCARVLLVDPDDRLLLFFSSDYMAPGVEYYVTVGGGLDDGESLTEGAVREVLEETGLRIEPADLGPIVAHASGLWSYAPGELIHSDDSYFFCRVDHFETSRDGLEPVEQEEITEARWMTVDQVAAVDHLVFPAPVAGLLKGLLEGTALAAPVELPWGAWCWDADGGWTGTAAPRILER